MTRLGNRISKAAIVALAWILAAPLAAQAALTHRWSFDVDGSDSVGGATMTMYGATIDHANFASGGGALDVRSGAYAGTAASIHLGSQFTIVLSTKMTSAGGFQTFVATAPIGTQSAGFKFFSYRNSPRSLGWEAGSGLTGSNDETDANIISLNQFHEVAAVVDKVAGTVDYYLDGSLVRSGATSSFTDDLPLFAGAFSDGPFGYHSGWVDEIRIYDTMLPPPFSNGDGVINSGEACDDGNFVDGDGCSSTAQVEDCWTCTGAPSVCTPGAQIITTLDSTGTVGTYTSTAIGADGLPIIAYYDETGGRIKLAHCSDAACSAATTTVVDATVGTPLVWQGLIRMIIGSDGLPFIAYRSSSTERLTVAHCNNLTCSSSTITLINSTGRPNGFELDVAVGSDGFPLILHGENTLNDRESVHCLNYTCTLTNTLSQSPQNSGYRYGHVTIGSDGFGLGVAGTGGSIVASHCTTLDCFSGVSTTVVTGGGASPWVAASDITLAPNGLGFFTYHDGSTGQLFVARCANTACSSISTSLVDGGVGVTTGKLASTSIKFGADGRAHMAYYDTDDGDLRFANCLDSDCTTSNRMTLDSTGNVGRYASMVRSGGHPLISYYDTTNGDLKVAYCAGASGNGMVDPGEQCDDGNFVDGDGCDATGQIESCHACTGAPSICTFSCGNGVVDPGEECDDGDLIGGDGCSSTGTVETCYGCSGQPSVCALNCGSDGNLDSSLDTDGRVTTSFGSGSERALAVAFQGDGKIVTAGRAGNYGNYDFAVARYNEDGTPDTTFSGDGKLSLDMAGEDDIAYGVAIQGDGKIVVAGIAFNGSESYNVALARFLTDGTLDTSFSGDGKQMSDFGGDDRAHGVAIQANGKIVIGGMRGDGVSSDFLVARYNADGTNDASFSGDGVEWTNVYGGYDQGNSVAIQADGRIVVAGLSTIGGNDDFSVVRYNSNGTLDTSFSGDGKLSSAVGSGADGANGVAIQPNGKIVMAGYSHNGTDNDFAVVRCNANGSPDPSFGASGKVTTAIGTGNDVARGMALGAYGRIIVAGYANTFGDDDFAVVRYNADGTLDTSFADDGRATTSIGAGDDQGFAVAVDASSRTVVAGDTFNGVDYDFAVVRYAEATCGNSVLESGEQCDDGNLAAGDCCSASCQFEAAASACADDGSVCTTDLCDGSGTCAHAAGNAGTTCRVAAGVCDLAETCDGASASCPADLRSTAVCRSAAGECDLAETCDGVANNCPADAKQTVGTTCSTDSNICTDDVCNGSSDACTHPANIAPCDDGAFCNGADTCSGGTCSAHAGDPCASGSECADSCNETADNCFDAAATPCSNDGNVCTTDFCTGTGTCQHAAGNAGTQCRASAGVCDLAETCNGASPNCPVDGKSTAECRASAGECDLAETCDGVGNACPVDTKRAGGSSCTSDSNVCTNDVCNGSGNTCTHPSNTAACDDGTFCNGVDTCSGGSCSSHAGDPCAAGSECADACNEGSDNCFDAASTPCTADGNVCTDDVCDGAGACGVNNTVSCDDAVYCNGGDTCAGGICNHSGDPCPGTDCNTCQEVSDSCFDPAETSCTDDADQCTRDRCNGAGTCAHPPIPLAEVCNWAIVGGSNTQIAKVRTRLGVLLDGGVCADKGEIGQSSEMLGDSSWAIMRASGSAVKVRGLADLEMGDAVTAGGCFKGAQGADILGTGLTSICCSDGDVALPGGGIVNACGVSPRLADCATAKAQVPGDISVLNALSPTQNLGSLSCTLAAPCTITAAQALNVIDIERLSIGNDGLLTIDASGNPDAVIVLRLAAGIRSKLRGSIALAGGAQARNVAIYAVAGNCDFGDDNTGAGTLFCPVGKVRLKLGSYWEGSIAAGASIDLGDNVILEHVPFLGLAD